MLVVFYVLDCLMVAWCAYSAVLTAQLPMTTFNIFLLCGLVIVGVLNYQMAKKHFRAWRYGEPIGRWWEN